MMGDSINFGVYYGVKNDVISEYTCHNRKKLRILMSLNGIANYHILHTKLH